MDWETVGNRGRRWRRKEEDRGEETGGKRHSGERNREGKKKEMTDTEGDIEDRK
jgi:hypothetical protein